MTAARDALVAAAEQIVVSRPEGVAGLLSALHCDPATSGMPIEAIALAPVPRSTERGADLVALLAVPDGSGRVHRPFAMVAWDPATAEVRDLREWGTRPPDTVPETGATWPTALDERALRTVCALLDGWVAGEAPDDPAMVAATYRDALSEEARSWYLALVPDTAPWLAGADSTGTDRPKSDGGTLGGELGGWIRAASALAEELGAGELAGRLSELAAERRRPSFRLAVVGEFNRGKSTLVNRLVGADLMETGPVPTTTTFSVVRAGRDGAESVVESVAEGGHRELSISCDWLAKADAELIDTPGTNESGEDRTADVRRAVTLSDGALLVVSAASPLTRTERELLEQEVLRRRMPFVAVVVSFLDQLDPQERAAALDRVRAGVARLAPGAPVLPGPGTTGGDVEVAALRDVVRGFASRNDNRRWRTVKIATAVADIAADIADVAAHAAAAAALDDGERATALARERAEVDRDTRFGDDVRVDLDSRRRRLAERVQSSLTADSGVITEALHHELLRAPDPKEYWDRDAAYRLRRELGAVVRKCESLVVAGMAADLEHADRTLAERLGTTGRSARPVPGFVTPEPVLPEGDVPDLSRRKLLTRVGATGGTIAGYVLGAAAGLAMPPIAIGMAGSLVAGLLAERSVRAATSAQREIVDRLLAQVVDAAVNDVADGIAQRLRSVYAEVGNALDARRTAWRRDRLRALITPPATAAPLNNLAVRASALAATVRAAISDDTTSDAEEP